MTSSDPHALGMATTVQVQRGVVALERGDATTALTHFEQALSADPSSAVAAWQRAVALARLGRDADALAAAHEALRHHPEHAQLRALVRRLAREPASVPSPSRPPPEATTWRMGDVIEGRWEVFGSAQGGMGRVYFVRDAAWGGLELAVKTLSTALDTPEHEVERVRALFRRETQVWLDLGAHPHIVSGFYTLEVGAALRFFMEYVPGRALDARLRDTRPSVAQALDLAIQLAAGVEYVHARGAVHRDLKSGNCLVTEDGVLRLTDFGLGKVATEGDAAMTASPWTGPTAGLGVSLVGAGTPWYMAPEQWRSLGEAGPAADVYAFGVLLYELFTGRFPFDSAPDAMERHRARMPSRVQRVLAGARPSRELLLWMLHAEVPPPSLRELDPDAPALLEPLAFACLAKRPEQRPDARTVHAQLIALHETILGVPCTRARADGLRPTEAGENNRAVSYFVMGEAPRARAILDRWLDVHPTAAYPWINRRVIDLSAGETGPARVALDFTRELGAAHGDALETDPLIADFARRLAEHAPWTRSAVASAVFAPDASHVLLASGSDAALIARGTVVRVLRGHDAAVRAIAIDAAGARALTGSYDKTARLFDLRSGATLRVFEGHREGVAGVAFSPDGERVLTGGGASHDRADRVARLWNASTGRLLHALRGPGGALGSVAFAPDGTRVALGSVDGTASLWDASRGELLWTFETADDRSPIARLLFADQGATLVIAQRGGSVTSWNAHDGRRLGVLTTRGPLAWMDVSPDGARFVLASEEGEVGVHARADGLRACSFVASIGRIATAVFSPDGHSLLIAGERGAELLSLRFRPQPPWSALIERPTSAHGLLRHARDLAALEQRVDAGDVPAFGELDALRDRSGAHARDAALALRIDAAARSHGGRRVALRDAWTLARVDPGAGIQGVAFAPDGSDDVLLGVSGRVGLGVFRWHTGRDSLERVLPACPAETSTLSFAPGGRVALAGGRNGALTLLRSPSGTVLRRLAEPGGPRVSTVAFSRDGRIALSGSEDGTTRLWDAVSGALLRTLRGHRLEVTSAVFSHDGARVLTGSWDGTARIQDAATAATLRVLEGHAGGVGAVAFGQHDHCAITAGEDATARVWSLHDGACLARLQGHLAGLTSVAASADGALIVTGSWDGTARVCDARTGATWRVLEGHGHGVTSVAFAPDDARLVTGSMDGSARLWVLDARWMFDRETDDRSLRANGQSARREGPEGASPRSDHPRKT